MKLNFTNKKERKNCQHFIKALKQIEKHNLKDNQRPVFVKFTSQQIHFSSTLSDIHKERVDNSCFVVIKGDAFTIQFQQSQEEGKVYVIYSYKMLRAFKKNQTKITLIQIISSNEGIKMYFETQGKQMECQLKVEGEPIDQRWPQQPSSVQQSNYEIVEIATVTDQQLNCLSMSAEQEQVWLQLCEVGVSLKTVKDGKYRKENKLILKQQNNYSFNRLKSKLKRRIFINFKGEYLLEQLYDTLKKKRRTEILIKNVYHSYIQNQINYSYLITKTPTDFGFIILANSAFTCEEMGSSGEQTIRRQIDKEKEARESSLLKREEVNIEDTRRIALNRFNNVDEDKRMAEEAYRERRPVGKIQEGEQTFTRRFYSKY